MALAVDSSSPAFVRGSGTSVTTASFSPPANSVLVAFVNADLNTGATNETCAMSSGGGLSWQLAGRHNGSPGAVCEVWVAKADAAPGSITATCTDNLGNSAGSEIGLYLRVLTDSGNGTPAGIGASNTGAAVSLNYTSTVANSWGFAVGMDSSGTATITAGSGQTVLNSVASGGFNSGDDIYCWRQNATTAVVGTTVTMNMTSPSSGLHMVAVEVLPAASVGVGTSPIALHPGKGPTRARFYQPPRDTTSFSASLTDG